MLEARLAELGGVLERAGVFLAEYGGSVVIEDEMERTLRESEERFRTIANYTYHWESWLGEDGRLLWVNEAVERQTGYSLEECMAMTDYPLPLVHEMDRERVAGLIDEALREKTSGHDEAFRVQHRNGEIQWMVASWLPTPSDGTVGEGTRLSIHDITQRKQNEQRLLEIRAALDDCGDAVVMLDSQHKVTYFNMTFGTLFHYTLDDSESIALDALWAEKSDFEGILASVMDGLNWDNEVEMISGKGSVFPALVRATPILDDELSILGTLIILSDVSRRKRLEAEMLQGQKLRSVGQLAAGVAHEINTPMQYIGDNARFVRDSVDVLVGLIEKYRAAIEASKSGTLGVEGIEALDAAVEDAEVDYLATEIPEALRQSLEGIELVTEIVSALRQFTHPGTAKKALANINKVVENAVVVSRNAWQHAAELKQELDPHLPDLLCFPGEIGEVILNLIVNATHAIEEDPGRNGNDLGRITVSSSHDQTHIELRVGDTGGGIPKAVQERIFDPFFTTRDVGKGTGQGLAIARTVVVEKHGGSLNFESVEGEGATFVVRLPIH